MTLLGARAIPTPLRTTEERGPVRVPVSAGDGSASMWRLRRMKVGSLVRYIQTNTLHLVTFFDAPTGMFHLRGWGDFEFGPLTEIEVINASG